MVALVRPAALWTGTQSLVGLDLLLRTAPAPARASAGAGRCVVLLIPAVGVLLAPGPVRGPVPDLDVPHAPADLGACVPLPARSRAGHLAAGDRLRNAVCARVRVGRITVPPAFGGPQPVQVLELPGLPAESVDQHRLGDMPRRAAFWLGLVRGRRDDHPGCRRGRQGDGRGRCLAGTAGAAGGPG